MAFDAFMNIPGVPGESTDDKHQNWIELLSFSHGVNQLGSVTSNAGNMASQRANFHDFTIVKELDKASPALFQACASGEHFSTVNVELCRAGGDKVKYMEYKLTDVMVTSVQPAGTAKESSGTLPTEVVSFTFGQIELTYTQTNKQTGGAMGQTAKGWSLTANKKV